VNAHVLGLSPVHSHPHVAASIDADLLARARRVDHHLDELSQHARRRRARHHADVKQPVDRRRRGGEVEKPSIGLDVRDGHECRLARYGRAVDLDLDAVERGVRELLGRHLVVREQSQIALARMAAELLDLFLDSREKAVALV